MPSLILTVIVGPHCMVEDGSGSRGPNVAINPVCLYVV